MSNPSKADYLTAMKAEAIPEGSSGLWFIYKNNFDADTVTPRHGKSVLLPAGQYTFLIRLTDSTLYRQPPGESVMEDTPFELRTHLGFVMRAYGNVLIGGLGLGCVIRGLLLNPNVEHVTCIENSKDVLKLVAPHMPTQRLTIIEADALEWSKQNKERFDCGWYDLWTDREAGQPHLDIWHGKLLVNLHRTVKSQGAWALNRNAKRLLLRKGFRWMG